MDIAIALLQHYSFDLGGYTIQDLTRAWADFRPEWVRQAVIEALFQGRYKAVSVTQILYLWERKGETHYRHNHEFERLVCGDVAVIYEDRIYYTPPRTVNREAAIAEIPPFKTVEENTPKVVFPRRSMLGTLKSDPTPSQVSQNLPIDTTKTPKHFSRITTPSGTTTPTMAYPEASNIEQYSEVYRSAYANMTLLAETSMFVDKLRSMCDRSLTLVEPKTEPMEVGIENYNKLVQEIARLRP